jgi:hypothetical protein
METMRKLILLFAAMAAIAAAAPAVAQAPSAVSLAVGRPGGPEGSTTTVGYKGLVEVSGEINAPLAGEAVEVLVTPYRGETTIRLVRTEADGEFTVLHRPTIRTGYTARWRGTTSNQEPFAHVRPLLSVRVRSHARGRFTVTMRADRAHASRVILFQRRITRTQWATVKRIRLRGTAMSATFTARIPRGLQRVRAYVPQTPGYLRATSDFVLVRR